MGCINFSKTQTRRSAVCRKKGRYIRKLWEEVKDEYIVKLAAGRVRIIQLNISNQLFAWLVVPWLICNISNF